MTTEFDDKIEQVVDILLANEKMTRSIMRDIVRSRVSWFCTGEGGTTKFGVPERIYVSPLYGSDAMYTYVLRDPT